MSFEKLGDICDVIDSLHKTPKYSDIGKPMVRCTDVKYGELNLSNTFKVSDEVFNEFSKRYNPEVNDIIITRVGSYGITAQVKDINFCLGQNTSAIKPKNINPDYLYLVLNSKVVKDQIEFSVVGSTQKTLSLKAINNLDIPRFGDEIENQIAIIGASLDDKIVNNAQTNQTLEQMAQAIFKSWFVDFDPVKAKMNGEQPEGMDAATASLFPEKLVESELGLIPEGWKVGDLSDLMDFNPKRTLKKGTVAPYLDMKNMPTSGHLALDIYDREMGSGTKFMNGDSLLARITPCLENGKTAYVDFLEDEQVGWGSTEYIVMRSKSDSYKYFSYYMARFEPFRKFAIQSMTGTSGRQRAQAQTVQTMPFAIPPISILEKFDEFVAPNMQMIKSHGSENRTLAALRDTLLPKLLSGEIELGQAQELAEVE
ncbi:restriction endonuclease subunit S [Vibrio alginolyticus]|nr:restriction endonuclease subunit S [Vibrio alginolyticus]